MVADGARVAHVGGGWGRAVKGWSGRTGVSPAQLPRKSLPTATGLFHSQLLATSTSHPPHPRETPDTTTTMAAEQRKLLEQLMGGSVTSRSAQLSITDPKVCRSYLAGTCPHDLFTNTKQDIGPCPRVHNEALKAEYEAMPEKERQRYGFEYDYMRDLQKYIEGVQPADRGGAAAPEEDARRDWRGRRTSWGVFSPLAPSPVIPALLGRIPWSGQLLTVAPAQNHIRAHREHIRRPPRGRDPRRDSRGPRALDEMHRVHQARAAKAERERELKELSDTSGPSGHQKLQVCDVCGAYLSRLDNDRRLADHFYGKMHLGYAQMRRTYEAFPREMRARGRGLGVGGTTGWGGIWGARGGLGVGDTGGGGGGTAGGGEVILLGCRWLRRGWCMYGRWRGVFCNLSSMFAMTNTRNQ